MATAHIPLVIENVFAAVACSTVSRFPVMCITYLCPGIRASRVVFPGQGRTARVTAIAYWCCRELSIGSAVLGAIRNPRRIHAFRQCGTISETLSRTFLLVLGSREPPSAGK